MHAYTNGGKCESQLLYRGDTFEMLLNGAFATNIDLGKRTNSIFGTDLIFKSNTIGETDTRAMALRLGWGGIYSYDGPGTASTCEEGYA